jgi:2-keto-4-pentenoate hydratase/2-oxohepta-3-ene-1,7-dioic acid hydratase in catechol pathway
MKILRFNDHKIGVLKNADRVVDISDCTSYRSVRGAQAAIEEIITNFELYKNEFERRMVSEDGIPLSAVTLLPPIPRPGKFLAAFMNYLDKPDLTADDLPLEYFYKAPELLGPEGKIVLLDIPQVVVYQAEAELAFVIGKEAKNVAEESAMTCVFGYMPVFDISARGMTRRTQFLPKGQATYGPCGPWITTKDEISDPHDLVVKSRVNDETRQNYSTRLMAHKIPEQLAWLSKFVQLNPGDVVATGTMIEGLSPINDGDRLEIEIEQLGKARFSVHGYGPPKHAEWIAGVSRGPKPQGLMTKV